MRYSLFIGIFLALAQPLTGQEAAPADSLAPQGTVIRREGSFLQPVQPRDSVLIADQLIYGFDMTDVPDSTVFRYPQVAQPFMENVVTVAPWRVDTLKVHKVRATGEKRYDIRSAILIAPFEEGTYELPPLFVERLSRDGRVDTLLFNPQRIEVMTMPVDTATFVPHDIKGQIRYPLTFREVFPYLIGFWIVALLVAGLVSWLISRKKAQDGPQFREPAHITALRKLDKFRGDKFWAPEKQKAFYSGVTDALREYIVARYGVGAMEMTTAEIFEGLKGTDVPAELYEEMKDLFERADFVKFAKFTASKEENATVLPQAVRFVTSTYQTEVEEEAESGEQEDAPAAAEKPRREERAEDYMPK